MINCAVCAASTSSGNSILARCWGRPELHRLLDQRRERDTLVIWIRRRTLLGASGVTAALLRRARSANKPIRIGVLTDMTGAYAANTGPGSVLGAQMAGEDFMGKHSEVKAEVVQADLQLKPDVALAIATDWFDNQGINLLTDVPLSSAAFERARTWRGGRSLGRPSARQRPVARERRRVNERDGIRQAHER
jgi:Periplasmic binding protein